MKTDSAKPRNIVSVTLKRLVGVFTVEDRPGPIVVGPDESGARRPEELRSALNRGRVGLEHCGHQLDRVVQTMDEFVFQANLLALEAAVEAGRSERGGRGLVNLAGRSHRLAIGAAEAAQNTAELAADIQARLRSGAELFQAAARELGGPDREPEPILEITSEVIEKIR